jgi:hypothetical protein
VPLIHTFHVRCQTAKVGFNIVGQFVAVISIEILVEKLEEEEENLRRLNFREFFPISLYSNNQMSFRRRMFWSLTLN